MPESPTVTAGEVSRSVTAVVGCALLAASETAAARVAGLRSDDVDGLVAATLPLADPIDRFFTDVLVMADDPALRASRLGLLQRIRDLPRRSFEVAQVPLPRS